jgi:hypothetical protein
MCTEECAHEHTGPAGNTRLSLRSGLTAYNVISPANGSFATVALQEVFFPKNLTPAPRRQDHTTSPYASVAIVAATSASTATPSRVVTIRETPLLEERDGGVLNLIWGNREAEYFRRAARFDLPRRANQ